MFTQQGTFTLSQCAFLRTIQNKQTNKQTEKKTQNKQKRNKQANKRLCFVVSNNLPLRRLV